MNVERVLHMAGGNGDTSYATNSRLQEKVILKTKPMVEKAIEDVRMTLLPKRMMVADLGCSSGPNTFLVISQVIAAVGYQWQKLGCQLPELQFFLNDLPGNDFNLVFMSLELFEKRIQNERGAEVAPHYIAGLPGSFYRRLFPSQCVHLYHSSYCLMWLSQVPTVLESKRGISLNKGNIYIGKMTTPFVVKQYQEQFRRDFSLFLKLRSEELVPGGHMVVSFLGRKNKDVLSGELSHLWGLLAEALQSLVLEGFVKEEKLDSFNLPFYAPSMEEIEEVIKREDLFDVNHFEIFESNWDPLDDSDNDFVVDSIQSGRNVAKAIRAVMAPLIAEQFGEAIVDDLFSRYACNLAKHLAKEKTKYPVMVLGLKARE